MEGMPGYSDLYVHLGHRGGHWSSSMKSFSARSSRTLNPLSCGCERHIDCSWSFSLECSGVVLSFDVRPWCLYSDLYIASCDFTFYKTFISLIFFNNDFS